MCIDNRRSEQTRSDEGWVLIEVVVAAAILFFVATALMGLVGASTGMSVAAKADAVAVNQVNSFMESVRELTYDDVTQAKLNQFATARSVTLNNVSLVITATVAPKWFAGQNPAIHPPAYKHVVVTVVAKGPVGEPIRMSAGTYVRPALSSGSDSPTGTPSVPKPTVVRTNNTPLSGAVVWGDLVSVGMEAQSGGSGVTLTRLQMTAGGRVVLEKRTTASSDSTQGVWATTGWADGLVEMRAQARDTLGQLGDLAWSVYVDNVPASAPTTPEVLTVSDFSSVRWAWSDTEKTTDPALSYRILMETQTSAGAVVPSEVTQSAGADTQTTTDRATTEFTRRRILVSARGPRAHVHNHLASESARVSSQWFIARQMLTGSTVSVTGAGKNNSRAILSLALRSIAPQFPVTGAVNYRWQYSYGPTGAWTDLSTTTTPALTQSLTAPVNGRFSDNGIRFRCVATLTPTGGSAVSVPSGVVGFTRSTNDVGATTMGAYDWTRWMTPPTTTPAIDWAAWRL